MSLIGSVAVRIARRRLGAMLRNAAAPRQPQQRVFDQLLARMRKTAFGREHGFERVRTHDDLRRAVPLHDYRSMAPWWDRARAGERAGRFIKS